MQDKQQIIEMTKKLMMEVNAECFNNSLNLNFPIEISNSGRVAGSVHCQILNLGGMKQYRVLRMKISKNYVWTEELLRNVVAHELIHVYEVQALKSNPAHGYQFKAKMNEINQKPNYSVVLRHSMKSTKPKAAKKSRNVFFILSDNKAKIVFVGKNLFSSLKLRNAIVPNFGTDYSAGIIDSTKLSGYRVQNKLKYSYKATPELIQKLELMKIG